MKRIFGENHSWNRQGDTRCIDEFLHRSDMYAQADPNKEPERCFPSAAPEQNPEQDCAAKSSTLNSRGKTEQNPEQKPEQKPRGDCPSINRQSGAIYVPNIDPDRHSRAHYPSKKAIFFVPSANPEQEAEQIPEKFSRAGFRAKLII